MHLLRTASKLTKHSSNVPPYMVISSMMSHRSRRRPQTPRHFLDTPYPTVQHDQYRPIVPTKPIGPTYLHPPPQPIYATQAAQRPPMQFHHQYRALPLPRSIRQFSQIGMPLSQAFHRAGHDTNSYAALRHAIQDLIDQGRVDLGRPGVTIDPLPTHETGVVPPPPRGVHLIEFVGDEIFMMGWDGEAPQPIHLDVIASSEPVLQISHNDDDLHLTRFTFDEVPVVSLEDDSRDTVPMSFD
ncbi:hypothetical protein CK203_109419 [Vitis vinifera]|uniref:Uncharacterized protein n=1 Tax=Vitis vinifera TaxID=29760 RepID=A0A438CVZ0_VITVI|nr:hypothetical protein CK203_109419 [Vitis vinifera]